MKNTFCNKALWLLIVALICYRDTLVFGQLQGKTHSGQETYTPSNDNYGTATVHYEYVFSGTVIRIKLGQVIVGGSVAMQRNEPELYNELRKRGILPYTGQNGAGVEIEFKAKASFLEGNYPVSGSVGGLRTDYVNFEPDDKLRKKNRSYYEKNYQIYYNKYGTLTEFRITDFYFSNLDGKIETVRRELADGKREQSRKFDALISKAKTFASGNNFSAARNTVSQARDIMKGQEQKNAVSEAESFIDKKEELAEEKAEEEKLEDEKQKTEASQKTTSGSSRSSKSSAEKSKKGDNKEAETEPKKEVSDKKKSSNELTQAQKDRLNYLNNMVNAGDKAMKSGDYSRAVEIYQQVQKSGGYVDEKRMNKALAGSIAKSTGDVLNSIPDPSGHKAVLAIDYALIDKFTDLNLTLRNKAYWSDYFSFNFAFGASYRSFEGLNEEDEAYRAKDISKLPAVDLNSFVVYKQQSFQTLGYKFNRAPADMLGAHAMFDLAVNIPIQSVAEISLGFFAGGKVFANLNDKGGATLYSYGPFAELSIGKFYFRYEHTTEGYSPGVNGPYFANDYETYFGQTIPERNSPISLNAMDDKNQKFNYGRLGIGFRWTLL